MSENIPDERFIVGEDMRNACDRCWPWTLEHALEIQRASPDETLFEILPVDPERLEPNDG